MIFRAPNDSPAHLALRRCAPSTLQEPLRHFLWEINAHCDLIALYMVCQNIQSALAGAMQDWDAHLSEWQLDDWNPILEWIDANSPQVKKILGYYVSNIWQNGTLLPFRDPEWPQPAIDYLEFLHSLEIEYSDIWLGSYHELKRSRWRRRWIEVFEEKLHHRFEIHNVKSRFKRDKTDSKQSASTSKMLLIEPIVGREKPGKSTAFRFMMVMAAIYFGYEE